jgi:hypothetical protein
MLNIDIPWNNPVLLVTWPGVIRMRTKFESDSVVKIFVTWLQIAGIWFFSTFPNRSLYNFGFPNSCNYQYSIPTALPCRWS